MLATRGSQCNVDGPIVHRSFCSVGPWFIVAA